ncbi:MAG: HAMP domain-containing histidine kinase, partial [Candidatus Omnitrophica bacterium]|nr:HAMP domain-containing histidine kinase [Candidatus Omnitrophota bacterium]
MSLHPPAGFIMKKAKLAPPLGILFILAVVIPSVALSIIAVRSLSREEAYLEKQTQKTLSAEVNQIASRLSGLLEEFKGELNRSLDVVHNAADIKDSFSQWKRSSPLVDTPFLLSTNQEILWPRQDQALSPQEVAFLNWNKRVLRDEVTIPVYENIAVAYKGEILKDQGALASVSNQRVHAAARQAEGRAQPVTAEDGAAEVTRAADVSYSRISDWARDGESYTNQQAISEFERSEPVRKKVYEQAKEHGQQILSRKVQVASLDRKADAREKQNLTQQSIFVAQPRTFSQIVAGADSGIIPCFIEDKLTLLFWKKRADANIVGCVINRNKLKDKFIEVLQPVYSAVRILTVLDEEGSPLVSPLQDNTRDWRRPFVAREISAYLPHWEVAAYLTDPGALSSRAHAIQLVMWMLISILFISIVSGGTLILRSMRSEIILAQQKTTFAANVSHELKTPLTSIRMFAEMLKEKRQSDEAKKEKYLDIMVAETERLTRLINNVLDFSRKGAGKIEYHKKNTDIVLLCKDVLAGQRIRLTAGGFEVKFISEKNEIVGFIDEEAIKQALLNLLSNAEKYSSHIKSVEVELTVEGN